MTKLAATIHKSCTDNIIICSCYLKHKCGFRNKPVNLLFRRVRCFDQGTSSLTLCIPYSAANIYLCNYGVLFVRAVWYEQRVCTCSVYMLSVQCAVTGRP